MFSIALQCKFKVQDFKSYSLQFPLKDPSGLTRNTLTIMKEMSKLREEDAHDDNLIALETSNQIDTCAQMHADKNAANLHILETTDVDNNTNSPLHVLTQPATDKTRDNFMLLPFILRLRANSVDASAAARPSVQHDEAGIDLHANLVDYTELEIEKHLHVILSR